MKRARITKRGGKTGGEEVITRGARWKITTPAEFQLGPFRSSYCFIVPLIHSEPFISFLSISIYLVIHCILQNNIMIVFRLSLPLSAESTGIKLSSRPAKRVAVSCLPHGRPRKNMPTRSLYVAQLPFIALV